MYLNRDQVSRLDYDGLKLFLERQIAEGHHLDYKQALTDGNDEKRNREFLKDVTAFANANGGDLVIGVREPEEGVPSENQIVGIEDGEDLARALERAAASGAIDPRIPGLLIQPIQVPGERWVIVVHVPPSSAKPHMVAYKGNTYLMQRHSESNQPMTSFDIRETVLASATAEDQAAAYAMKQRTRLLSTVPLSSSLWFIFQAMPLARPDVPVDVFASGVVDAIRGSGVQARSRKFGQLGFASLEEPYPTVEGIGGQDHARDDCETVIALSKTRSAAGSMADDIWPRWYSEFHRNGHVLCAYRVPLRSVVFLMDGRCCPAVTDRHHQLFRGFGDLCDELVGASGIDARFAVACLLTNAEGSRYTTDSLPRGSEPCPRQQIEWPTALRQPGDSFGPIMEAFVGVLRNAYGLR